MRLQYRKQFNVNDLKKSQEKTRGPRAKCSADYNNEIMKDTIASVDSGTSPNPTKFHEDPSIISDATVVTRFFHILVCVLHNIIGGATSITYVLDFGIPHDPTKFSEDPPTISDARMVTRFSHFRLCIS